MKGETARLNKMRETIQRKLRNVEDQKADVEQQKETLKSQIIGLERGTSNNNYIPKSVLEFLRLFVNTEQYNCASQLRFYVPLAELEQSKKQSEQDKKAIEELVRERDILNKNMLKAAGNTQKQLNLVKLHEQSKKNLEQEIQNYKEEAQKQRKIIYQLEKERDRYINEASDLTQKVVQRFSSSRFYFGPHLIAIAENSYITYHINY